MRPTQYRHNALYLATEPDEYVVAEPALKGFSFAGDGWVHIRPGGVFTHRADRAGYHGFAWDGCSPKFALGPLLLGTWDGAFKKALKMPEAVRAAKFHDALYQDLDLLAEIGFRREHADLLFLEMLRANRFRYASLYYRAVRLFGGLDLSLWRLRSYS